jgi:hypothetical protein
MYSRGRNTLSPFMFRLDGFRDGELTIPVTTSERMLVSGSRAATKAGAAQYVAPPLDKSWNIGYFTH